MDFVVVGVATQQTALPVDGFPVEYEPRYYVPGAITVEVGGAGFSVARHAARLGHRAFLVAPIGEDVAASTIDLAAERHGVNTSLCLRGLRRTPRSVVLTDPVGRRTVFTDLDEVTEADVDSLGLRAALVDADVVVLGNLDLSRPLIPVVREAGVSLAVDLQDVRDPSDPELDDFLEADILTMSNAYVAGHERESLEMIASRTRARIVMLTMGAAGLLIWRAQDGQARHVPAPEVGPVTTTEGAGDVFLASFLDAHLADGMDPVEAARRAAAETSVHLSAEQARPRHAQHGEYAEDLDPHVLARRMGRPWVTGGLRDAVARRASAWSDPPGESAGDN